MLALEEHLRVPLGAQREDADFAEYPDVAALVTRMSSLCDTHVQTLRSALESIDKDASPGAKPAIAQIEGSVAATIEKLRSSKVGKALRDDYTTLSLCCINYGTMLATAKAIGNARIPQLAERHLRDYARAMLQIGEAMPEVVVQELRAAGFEASSDAIAPSRSAIATAWRSSIEGQAQVETGSIESTAAANRAASPTYPTI